MLSLAMACTWNQKIGLKSGKHLISNHKKGGSMIRLFCGQRSPQNSPTNSIKPYNARMFSESQKGQISGIACFVFWGFAPIYFKLIQHVPSIEIIAHRVIWSAAFLFVFLLLRERQAIFSTIRINRAQIMGLLLSGSLIISNWLIFVWAVNSDRVLATSMGYFINPLVNVLLGMLFLGERLSRIQQVALLLAAFGTIFLGIYLGQPPWIALALAITFGLYGLVRKKIDIRPLVGLWWESLWFMVPALVYLLMYGNPEATHTAQTTWLLVLAGLVTIIPLIAFNYAAKRLTLTHIGFLQYIAPTISFCLAVLFYQEAFTLGHQVAFVSIWAGLFILSLGSIKKLKKNNPT